MPFPLMDFVVCRTVAQIVDPSQASADQAALLATMMPNTNLAYRLLFTSAFAQSLAPAPPPPNGLGIAARPGGRRAQAATNRSHAAAVRGKVRVPRLDHLRRASHIHEHLQEHRLAPRFHYETAPEVKESRVLRHWPEAGAEVDEGTEIDVFFLVPEGIDGDEARASKRTAESLAGGTGVRSRRAGAARGARRKKEDEPGASPEAV
jgi:hypothetical protein